MVTAQKPETFMLSTEAQQKLPHDAQVALQQVDNRECLGNVGRDYARDTLNFMRNMSELPEG